MTTRTRHAAGSRPLALAAAGALVLASLAGCSSGPLSKNKGGDTTCGDYMEMPPEEQREVITTFLDDKGQPEPVGMDVTLRLEASKLYCSTVGQAGDPIRNADTG